LPDIPWPGRATDAIVSDSAENRVVLAAYYADLKERRVRSSFLAIRDAEVLSYFWKGHALAFLPPFLIFPHESPRLLLFARMNTLKAARIVGPTVTIFAGNCKLLP